ncbi:Ig-like domain-containing protein [Burkholderia pyrrocinia]|uniref:Ig-like domain-containing protein n=1 Tax=Burkholderia pyrrocinia TaxID=60550 RepID=UPI00104CAC72|nr:Ig-like domain-containing protein [Burkholderia pyrrocinia]TDA47476.1 hypothetical protein EVG18_10700 [Burkholderia pyrrocinia]
MSVDTIKLAVVNGKTVAQTVDLGQIQAGTAAKIKAVPNGQYILSDASLQGAGPKQVTAFRSGKDLYLSVDGSSEPQLVIEDYYGSNGELLAQGADGQYYTYDVAGATDAQAASITDNTSELLSPSATPTPLGGLVTAPGINWLGAGLAGLAGAAAIGGIAAAATRSGGGSTNDAPPPEAGAGATPDEPAPSRPLIDAVRDNTEPGIGLVNRNDATNEKTPTVTGRAQIGTIVYLYVDGGSEPIGSARIEGGDGTWTIPVTDALQDGTHTFTAVAVNPVSGLASDVSRDYPIVVDTISPEPPVITELGDNVGDVTLPIHPGDTTDDPRPIIKGTAEANSVVYIYDTFGGKETLLGSERADDNGNWSFQPANDLDVGVHSLQAKAQDAASNMSEWSAPFDFTLDLSGGTTPPRPDAPTIDFLVDNVGDEKGEFGNGYTTDDPKPGFKGTAVAGSTVYVYLLGKSQALLGTALAGDDGVWELPFPADRELSSDYYEIGAFVETPDGMSEWSDTFDFKVILGGGTTPPHPEAPTIDFLVDNVGDEKGDFGNGYTTDDPKPGFKGTAVANSIVYIYLIEDGLPPRLLGSTPAGANGNWDFQADGPFGPGTYSIAAIAKTGDVESPMSDVFDFTVELSAPPAAPTIDQVIDDVGDARGPLDPNDVTDDPKPVIRGTGEPGYTIYILDNGVSIGTALVQNDGSWKFEPTTALPDGAHSLTAMQFDVTGTPTGVSGAFPFEINTLVIPDAPSITQVKDNAGTVVGPLNPGDTTDDAHPWLYGTAQPKVLIVIYDTINGIETPIASTMSDWRGNWDLRLDNTLPEGAHSLTAKAQNAKGESGPSDAFEFFVDTNLPSPDPDLVTIDSVTDNVGNVTGPLKPGETTDDPRPVIKGTAQPNFLVLLYDNATLIGSETADEYGNWKFRPVEPLDNDLHSLTAMQQAPDGKTYGPSDAFEFVVAAPPQVPDAPTIDYVFDNVGAETGNIYSGETTDDARPVIHGRAEPNSIVYIYDTVNGVQTLLGTALAADPSGEWSLRPAGNLPNGEHTFTAIAHNDIGEGLPSAAFDLTIDAQPSLVDGSGFEDFEGLATGQRLVCAPIFTDWSEVPSAKFGLLTVQGRGEWFMGNYQFGGATVGEYIDNNTPPLDFYNKPTGQGGWDPYFQEHNMLKLGNLSNVRAEFVISFAPTTAISFTIFVAKGDYAVMPSPVFNVYDTNNNLIGTMTIHNNPSKNPSLAGGAVSYFEAPPGVEIGSISFSTGGDVSSYILIDHVGFGANASPQGSIPDVQNNGASTNDIDLATLATVDGESVFANANENSSAVVSDSEVASQSPTADVTGSSQSEQLAGETTSEQAIVTPAATAAEPSEVAANAASNDADAALEEAAIHAMAADDLAAVTDGAGDAQDEAEATAADADDADPAAEDLQVHIEAEGALDVLVVEGEGQVLDLSKLAEAQPGLDEIEAIDLTGTGANTLKVSLGDVLQYGEKDLFVEDGRTQLMVRGDADDVVDLSGLVGEGDASEWVEQGEKMVEGVAYTVYENSAQNAELLVQQGVTTNLV